jgi:CubicO group peptidase (beta-lactamase class C family)
MVETLLLSGGDLLMRTLYVLFVSIVLLSFWTIPVAAVESSGPEASGLDTEALDAYLAGQMDKHGIKGISLAVTSGTEIVYLKGYGTAGAGRPLTPQTPMYIGSVSKSFTGLAIAQLIEQGKIDPNEPVQTYIPWFTVADEEASKTITISHLLHHTSGLSESGFASVLPENATKEEAVRALASARLTAPVAARHQYFNYGYVVLTLVLEHVTGQSYEDYVQQNIFDPLDMTSTYTDPQLARQNGLSQGYSRFFGFVVPQRQPHRLYEIGEGFIMSTAEDMARYAIAMDNAGAYRGRQLLSFKGMEILFRPVQGYGMGWYVEQGHIFHGGANETFKTFVDIYPLRDMSFVLLINQGYMFDHYLSAPQIVKGVEAIVLGRMPPPVSQGGSVSQLGWGLLVFVVALSLFQTRNLLALRGWRERRRQWSAAGVAWDIASSFLIPTLILVVVLGQVKAFLGYRFNLTYQMLIMFRTLPDIAVLMIVGSVPDYAQGFVKLYWLWSEKIRGPRTLSLEEEKWIRI